MHTHTCAHTSIHKRGQKASRVSRSQVLARRMNKIRLRAEDFAESTRYNSSLSHLHPHYASVYAGLRNIIISRGKINNYGVYLATSLRVLSSFPVRLLSLSLVFFLSLAVSLAVR